MLIGLTAYELLHFIGDKNIMKGYVQVYTGNGKGKTTAALGLSIRAAGAGLSVYILQFMKSGDYSEIKALKKFSQNITVEQFGTGRFIKAEPAPEEIKAARKGLAKADRIVKAGRHDVVILDEANVAVYCRLFSIDELMSIVRSRPDHVELVITGRSADEKLIEAAGLVTEMREIKHYFAQGVPARIGIEK